MLARCVARRGTLSLTRPSQPVVKKKPVNIHHDISGVGCLILAVVGVFNLWPLPATTECYPVVRLPWYRVDCTAR